MPQWTDEQLGYYLATKDTVTDNTAFAPRRRPDAALIEAWYALDDDWEHSYRGYTFALA